MCEESEKVSYKFPKEGRLHHRSLVEGLFRKGKSFYEFPFRVTWRPLSQEELENNFRNNVPEGIACLQMMVTVPKKKRRKATDRVLMRRRIKEAFRLHRISLVKFLEDTPQIRTLSCAIVYIHDKNSPFSHVEEKMKALLLNLEKRVSQTLEK